MEDYVFKKQASKDFKKIFSNEKKKKAISTFFFSVLFSFWPNVRTAVYPFAA